MAFEQRGEIRFFSFDSFPGDRLAQAIFTRQGGVSPPPWDSLNVGGGLGDESAHVRENQRRAVQALGRDPASVYDVWQVHGARVVCADRPRPPDQPYEKADAILTDRPQVTLFMRFADCTPILLYDPRRGVVGAAHAGWQGTVRRTAAAAVQAMQSVYGCRLGDILAGIGPAIGAHHYPVGPEVVAQARAAFGARAEAFFSAANGNSPAGVASPVQFDLWAANRAILAEAGVEQIESAEICTACSPADWFSHRGEAGRTGRFGALIALKD